LNKKHLSSLSNFDNGSVRGPVALSLN
jgi:hypothetical protein